MFQYKLWWRALRLRSDGALRTFTSRIADPLCPTVNSNRRLRIDFLEDRRLLAVLAAAPVAHDLDIGSSASAAVSDVGENEIGISVIGGGDFTHTITPLPTTPTKTSIGKQPSG